MFYGMDHPEQFSGEDWENAILRSEFLRDLYLGNYGELDTRRVEIRWAKVSGRLDLSYCKIRQPILFRQCFFSEGISLLDSVIPILHLKRCLVRGIEQGYDLDTSNALNANRLKSGYVMLDKGFIADGDVSLGGADIDGHFDCSSGIFEGGLLAQELKAGDVRLNKGFTVKGEVNLINADIRGQVVCQDGIFNGKIIAQNLNANVVFLRKGFIAKSDVNLIGAKINGQLVCSGGKFEGSLIAQGMEVVDVILRDDFMANRDVNFMNARIDGQLVCTGSKFRADLELADAKLGTFASDKQSWPRKGFLSLDGFRCQHLDGGAGDSAEAGLEWLSRMGDDFCPQPYEQLMSVYRRMGRPDWAWEIGFELETRKHMEHKESKNWFYRSWENIRRGVNGYGYKPYRILKWAFGLWLVGTLAFGAANLSDCGILSGRSLKQSPAMGAKLLFGIQDRSKCSSRFILPLEGYVLTARKWVNKKQIPENYPPFVPAAYALQALLPTLDIGLDIGQLDKWRSENVWLQILRWVMTLFGLLLQVTWARFGIEFLGLQRWRGGEGE